MILLLAACNEFVLREPPVVPPAEPPAEDPDAAFGEPPDWSTCSSGWYGQYYNLPAGHADLEPADGVPAVDDLDWWRDDRLAFRRYDPSLDFGANWWPVEEGFEGDPAYFATRWTAWMRVTGGSSIDVVLGARTVAWMYVDGEIVAEIAPTEAESFESPVVSVPVRSGQVPVELRFGQLEADASGFRFRIASGEAELCYPDFSGG